MTTTARSHGLWRGLAWLALPALLALLGGSAAVAAAELQVSVQEPDGDPIEHAVVYALPLDPDGRPAPVGEPVVIDQIDKEYVPYVTAVRVGTSISFPNKDQIRHHVYSFSEAKNFEIPLYEGVPAEPVEFDKAGSVPLGCNIHDWMKAYVFVTEAPYFAVTEASGRAIVELPSGNYAVEVWHPALKGEPSATSQRLTMDAARSSLDFVIERKRVWKPRRAPSRGGAGSYR